MTAQPASSSEPKQSDPPSSSTMYADTKRHNTTPKRGLSSTPMKKTKNVDAYSPEAIAKEMSVGFGLDMYWYDSIPFP